VSSLCRRTVDEIVMHGDPDTIYRLAAEIERWPEILPHYRWVTVLGECAEGRIVEMAARRSWIPVKWQSVQAVEPVRRRVYYRHTGGLTKGMGVEWIIEPQAGHVDVSIVHDLALETTVVRSLPGRWIVARFFVRHIAGRTLSRIRDIVEAEWKLQHDARS
jgi:ribosome-associated toxin RatA of RatAB toxin-antitoxin module